VSDGFARFGPWLQLGRVSNLPTVWTNCLTALVLGGARVEALAAIGAVLSMSIFYTAGMVLNDVFDADYDAKHRSTRPIPSGQVTRTAAAVVGFGGLALGIGCAALTAFSSGQVRTAVVWTTVLALAIVGYDVYHKRNPVSPVLMGLCGALVVVSVNAMFASETPLSIALVAGLHCLYAAGLTYSAKQEDLARPGAMWPVVGIFAAPVAVALAWAGSWPPGSGWHWDWLPLLTWSLFLASAVYGLGPLLERPKRIGVAVGRLIAGIAVLDALFIAGTGEATFVAVALACAVFTRLGQRYVPGT
jgi:UbiA prenyltransferase family